MAHGSPLQPLEDDQQSVLPGSGYPGERLYLIESLHDQSRKIEKLQETVDNKVEALGNKIDNKVAVIDDRLRKIEHKVWFACGGIVIIMGILWFITQAVLSSYTLTIVPKGVHSLNTTLPTSLPQESHPLTTTPAHSSSP